MLSSKVAPRSKTSDPTVFIFLVVDVDKGHRARKILEGWQAVLAPIELNFSNLAAT